MKQATTITGHIPGDDSGLRARATFSCFRSASNFVQLYPEMLVQVCGMQDSSIDSLLHGETLRSHLLCQSTAETTLSPSLRFSLFFFKFQQASGNVYCKHTPVMSFVEIHKWIKPLVTWARCPRQLLIYHLIPGKRGGQGLVRVR